MARHEVGVRMREEHPLDGQIVLLCVIQVPVDVAVRVHQHRFRPGHQQVGIVAQHRKVKLHDLKPREPVGVHDLVEGVLGAMRGRLGIFNLCALSRHHQQLQMQRHDTHKDLDQNARFHNICSQRSIRFYFRANDRQVPYSWDSWIPLVREDWILDARSAVDLRPRIRSRRWRLLDASSGHRSALRGIPIVRGSAGRRMTQGTFLARCRRGGHASRAAQTGPCGGATPAA